MAKGKVLQKILKAIAILATITLILLVTSKGTIMPNWADEFNGPAGSPPEFKNWTAVVNGDGGGNQELQYYVPEATALDGNGNMVITADRDNGRYNAWYGKSQYTSGKMWTAGKVNFRYGHIEVQASIQGAGKTGAWPAIWMLGSDFPSVGWPACGEIDIMESFGRDGTAATVSSAIHTPTDNLAKSYTFPTGDATSMHTYALDWRPSSLIFSVDGKAFFTVNSNDVKTWPFDKPQFLILNYAVGGQMGGDPASAVMPYRMVVSGARAYNSEISLCLT